MIELEVDEIGLSLKYANAKVSRVQRCGNGQGQAAAYQGGGRQPAPQDDPWATRPQEPAGSWASGTATEPPF